MCAASSVLLSLFVKIFTLGGKEALGVKQPSMGHGKKRQTIAAPFTEMGTVIVSRFVGLIILMIEQGTHLRPLVIS